MPNELDWNAAEAAVYAWVKAAFGALVVRWVDPNKAEPSTDYASISLGDALGLGMPEQQIHYSASRDGAGQGVEIRTGGTEELLLTISVYTQAVYGADSALSKTAKARNKLAALETSERTAMRAAGVTVSRFSSVRSLPTLAGSAFRGVAILEVRLYAQDFASTYTTWIEHVTSTLHVT